MSRRDRRVLEKSLSKPVGIMRAGRTRMALTAFFATAALACIPALPASADAVHEQTVTQALQQLSVSDAAESPVINRDGFSSTAVQSPVPADTQISSPYGYRIAPCAGCSTNHQGVDLLAGNGNPVEAIADGIVSEIGNPSGALGVYVVVEHLINGQRITSVYGHMALGSMKLKVGDVVTRGEVVGKVGSTGTSTGPHLYFQIRVAGIIIDPEPWLKKNVNKSY